MNNLLGIDYGERYIGLAIKKDNAPIPYAHKVVDIKEHDIIKEIVNIVPINGAVIFNVVNSGSLICSRVIKAINGKGIFNKPLKMGGK